MRYEEKKREKMRSEGGEMTRKIKYSKKRREGNR